MNDWKELEIDNLPGDIMTGGYEFMHETKWLDSGWDKSIYEAEGVLFEILKMREGKKNSLKYRYRKPEPKQPTHEEIIAKWWKFGDRGWHKILYYMNGFYFIANPFDNDFKGWNKNDFIGQESADIPPETEA